MLAIVADDPPGLDGADILERIRSWSDVPIIILSPVTNESQKVRLLRLGADDYVVKPFGIAELLARSDAALRRHLRSTNREPVVRTGALSIGLVSRMVTLEGKRIQFTAKDRGRSDSAAVDRERIRRRLSARSTRARSGTAARRRFIGYALCLKQANGEKATSKEVKSIL